MLYDRVYTTIKEYSLIPENATVICALSGGADSICLADVLCALRERLNFTLECAHVNHNLRGKESDGDEQFVRDFCAKKGLTLHVASIDVLAESAGKSAMQDTDFLKVLVKNERYLLQRRTRKTTTLRPFL